MAPRSTLQYFLLFLAIAAAGLTIYISATGGFVVPVSDEFTIYADTVTFGLRAVALFLALYTFAHPVLVDAARRWFRGEETQDDSTAKRATFLFLTGLTIAGFGLRINTIAPFLINPDEAMFVHTSQASDIPGVISISRFHGHPPANYIMLFFLLKISTSIAWLRMPSLLTGLALIPLSYITARPVMGRPAAIAAAAMMTFSPGLIELSGVCRNYSPLFVLILLTLYFVIRFLQENRWPFLAIAALCQLYAVNWHYNFIILLIAIHACMVVVYIHQRRSLNDWITTAFFHLPVMTMAVLLYIWHIRYFSEMRAESYAESWMTAQFNPSPVRMFTNTRDLFATLLSGELSYPALLLALGGIFVLIRQRAYAPLMFLLAPFFFAYVFVILGKMPYGGTRHTLYIFPFALGLVAVAISAISNGLRWRWVIALAGLFFAGNALYINISLNDHQELPVLEREFREALAILDERVAPNDIVLFDQQSALALSYHVAELEPWDWGDNPYVFQRAGQDWEWYYWPEPTSGWYFKPATFANSALRIAEHYDLKNVGRVWTIHLGWEEQKKLRRQIEKDHESIKPPDTGRHPANRRGSRNLLFALEWEQVVQLAREQGVKVENE